MGLIQRPELRQLLPSNLLPFRERWGFFIKKTCPRKLAFFGRGPRAPAADPTQKGQSAVVCRKRFHQPCGARVRPAVTASAIAFLFGRLALAAASPASDQRSAVAPWEREGCDRLARSLNRLPETLCPRWISTKRSPPANPTGPPPPSPSGNGRGNVVD